MQGVPVLSGPLWEDVVEVSDSSKGAVLALRVPGGCPQLSANRKVVLQVVTALKDPVSCLRCNRESCKLSSSERLYKLSP